MKSKGILNYGVSAISQLRHLSYISANNADSGKKRCMLIGKKKMHAFWYYLNINMPV